MNSGHDWLTSEHDWAAYARRDGTRLPDVKDFCPLDAIPRATWNIAETREARFSSQNRWALEHPLSSVGYESCDFAIKLRDGAEVAVKASWPKSIGERGPDGQEVRTTLPVLFVTHGGGWMQGTHAGEEQWLLWPLYEHFALLIISVEYRLAPEHQFPTWIEDSWEVLETMLSNPRGFVPHSHISLKHQNIILAGSSAGACITAVLSQRCRDLAIPVRGVILNVPVLCDYRHLPRQELLDLKGDRSLSYEQCMHAALSSGIMKAVWDIVIPSPSAGSSPQVSPLLGRVDSLPNHLIYVAGQDPLRDEGILYAHKLQRSGVSVALKIYPGVPHIFAEMHDLKRTTEFWADIRRDLRSLLSLD